jgi:serine/threonine protein kinase
MFMGFGYDTDKSVFILTEYMEEGTLSQALYERSGDRIGWASKIRWLADIADGLSYLHSKGGLHRDLKSSNILLSKESDGIRAKLGDFGLSALIKKGKKRVRAANLRGQKWQADEWIKSMGT